MPDQRIARADGVVEERERLVLLQRQEPQAELRHLGGQWVLVHAVQARARPRFAGRRSSARRRPSGMSISPGLPVETSPNGVMPGASGCCFVGVFPCLDQPLGQIPARLDQESPRAAGHVADFQFEQFGRRAQLPLFLGLSFGRPDEDQWLQGVADNRLGEAGRRVVGARGSAVGSLGDVDAALADDERLAEAVVPHDAGKRAHPLEKRCVVAARGPQAAGILGVLFGVVRQFQRIAQGVFALARLLVEKLDQVVLALGPKPLQFGQWDFRVFALGSHQAQHRLGRPLGGVVQEALVDVADLLDVERNGS